VDPDWGFAHNVFDDRRVAKTLAGDQSVLGVGCETILFVPDGGDAPLCPLAVALLNGLLGEYEDGLIGWDGDGVSVILSQSRQVKVSRT